MEKKVLVVIGTGGMGIAIARRIGTGHKLLLADYDQSKVDTVAADLRKSGYDVDTQQLDVVDIESVERLASSAQHLGDILAVVNTAGVSSTIASSKRIFEVNLLGAVNVIDIFEKYVTQGAVGILIASMAGYGVTENQSELQKQIKEADRQRLVELIDELSSATPTEAYVLSKRGIHLKVQSAAITWGNKGARILSVSPGITATPQARDEMEAHNSSMRQLIEKGPIKRMGTPEDIAELVNFLHSPSAGFMTGVDILIDGGATAFMQSIGKMSTNR